MHPRSMLGYVYSTLSTTAFVFKKIKLAVNNAKDFPVDMNSFDYKIFIS